MHYGQTQTEEQKFLQCAHRTAWTISSLDTTTATQRFAAMDLRNVILPF